MLAFSVEKGQALHNNRLSSVFTQNDAYVHFIHILEKGEV